MTASRRDEALAIAEELLSDIELGRLTGSAVVRKASRLARLLDDTEAVEWLAYEMTGFPSEDGAIPQEAWDAAERSHRIDTDKDGNRLATTTLLGELEAQAEASLAQLAAAQDPSISVSSANPYQVVSPNSGNARERQAARTTITKSRALQDRVLGSIHGYVSDRYQELRFGAAVESAFEIVRRNVDGRIAALVPDGLPKLSAALENITSDNPEHWAQAAATCRRLLKATADRLNPPGPDRDGRKMGPDNYVNRIAAWAEEHLESETLRNAAVSDLEYLGRRLDAFDSAGHKGAHAEVPQLDAARFVTGTYLLLGDILLLESIQELHAEGEIGPGGEALADSEDSASRTFTAEAYGAASPDGAAELDLEGGESPGPYERHTVPEA